MNTDIGSIALVAKPWRGGLANYMAMTMERMFPGRVSLIYTYPVTAAEKRAYRANRQAWKQNLMARVNALDVDAVLFLNILPEFAGLEPRPGYVLWLTDNPVPALQYLAPYARVLVSDPGYAAQVRAAVGEHRFAGSMPFACQPEMHRPVQGNHGKGFCFVANQDVKRDRVLRFLFSRKHPVHVYGNYFLRNRLFWRYPQWFRPPVKNEKMMDVYARHMASLNIHADVVREGTNMRTFECAAYGIPQLVEYRPGLEMLFDVDTELYVYRTEEELLMQMDRMHADPPLARKRAQEAYRHVMAEHTYRHRIEQLLALM